MGLSTFTDVTRWVRLNAAWQRFWYFDHWWTAFAEILWRNCLMSVTEQALRAMPDIANEVKANVAGRLDWVGMDHIEIPVNLAVEGGVAPQASARVTAFVNLNRPETRGIHMSRLYLHLDRHLGEEALTPGALRNLLRDFLDSHEDLSDQAFVRIDFDYLVRRPALRSEFSGWKRYPVHLAGLLSGNEFRVQMGTEITYSSTCPCSAARARQVIQEQFRKDFSPRESLNYESVLDWLGSEEGICATPHSQRSTAEIRVKLAPSFDLFPILELIDAVEDALATPVQTAVKREDEQAFAELNGQNLMFCEDAARRIQDTLSADTRLLDFWAKATHFESLHPHNAVAVIAKGVPGGFVAG
jgi:GTP cyclohydrolase I